VQRMTELGYVGMRLGHELVISARARVIAESDGRRLSAEHLFTWRHSQPHRMIPFDEPCLVAPDYPSLVALDIALVESDPSGPNELIVHANYPNLPVTNRRNRGTVKGL